MRIKATENQELAACEELQSVLAQAKARKLRSDGKFVTNTLKSMGWMPISYVKSDKNEIGARIYSDVMHICGSGCTKGNYTILVKTFGYGET